MRPVTVSDVEHVALRLARERLSFDEPIPAFATRFPNVLESCLLTPFQRFGGKPLYPTLVAKASMLFYLMIKNHPFQNGNKRIAMTTLFVFLYCNGKWLKTDAQELYNFTVWVAQSPPRAREHVVRAVQDFIKRSLVDNNELSFAHGAGFPPREMGI